MVCGAFGRGKNGTITEVNRVRVFGGIYMEFVGEMWFFVALRAAMLFRYSVFDFFRFVVFVFWLLVLWLLVFPLSIYALSLNWVFVSRLWFFIVNL
jgi:hypothetical protein